MTVEQRREIEKRIASKVIEQALHLHNGTVRVHDGEEMLPHRNTVETALEDMFSVDEETLWVYDEEGNRIGGVFFVYGNSGWDVCADWSSSMESVMTEPLKLADQICDEEYAK